MRVDGSKRQVEHVNVSDLIPYARNPRTHSAQQVKQIAASIREFGFTNPILIADDNTVIAGHGRLQAALHLGLGVVPCIRLSGLTEPQRRAYVIADNKLTLNGAWDADMLKVELDDLHAVDFDMDLLGFDADELSEAMRLFEEHEDQSDLDKDHTKKCPHCGGEL